MLCVFSKWHCRFKERKKGKNKMKYYSTRDTEKKNPVSSAQAIKQGIAPDGGLYMPDSVPKIDEKEIASLSELSYTKRAAAVLSKFLTDYTYEELVFSAEAAYSEEKFRGGATGIASLGDKQRVLELWHGPTCAFKDMALQIMPRLLSFALEKTGEKRTALILVATSGDTGKAALEGYKDVDHVKIMVFYPENGVSAMQKLQMISQTGGNVNVCAIKGNFDDAQTGVKRIFSDEEFSDKLNKNGIFLSSANSINWGRLVPQIVYYISAYCDLVKNGDIKLGEIIDITVPTGNFGNIFAAYMAKLMGMPFGRLICASNRNNILTDFINTGIYDRNREFYTTMSPSMDILISSNLERLLYVAAGPTRCTEYMKKLSETGRYEVDRDVFEKIRESFSADFCDEENTAKVIKETFEKYSYLADTHTACALYASYRAENKNAADGRNVKILTASTASPYKFAADVLRSLGKNPDHTDFEVIYELSELTGTAVPAPLAALRDAEIRFKDSVGKSKEDMLKAVESFAGII